MKKYKQKPWNAVAAAEKLIGNKDPRIDSLVRAYLSGLNSNKSALQAHLKIETAREILRNDPRTKKLFCSRPSAPRPLPSPEDDAKCVFRKEVLGQTKEQATASVGKTIGAYHEITKRSPEVMKTYRERKLQYANMLCDALDASIPELVNGLIACGKEMLSSKRVKNTSTRDNAIAFETIYKIFDYKEPVATDVNVNFEARRDFVAAIDDAVNCDEPMSIEEQEGPYAQKQLQTDQYLDSGDKNDD